MQWLLQIYFQEQSKFTCLDGISSDDMKNIMDYIYNGEVNIYQENLDGFLNVEQRLKLEGLIVGKTEEDTENENHSNQKPERKERLLRELLQLHQILKKRMNK